MPGKLTLDDLKTAAATGEIDTVTVAMVDMQGRLMGKRFHVDHFLASAWEETHGCTYLLATDLEMSTVPGYEAASWARGYGDYTLRPDLSTLRRTPWAEGAALVLCDVLDHHGHAEIAHSPRALLRRQVERLAAQGLTANAAPELEFYLFRESYDAVRDGGHRGLTTFSAYNQDYHILQGAKEEPLLRAMRNALVGADIPVEGTKGEADAGQSEMNVRYADALTMADRHAITKTAMKEIAHAQGRALTFMAKWSDRHVGSSCHVHLSLSREDGSSAFFDPAAPHGMSALMRSWVAGMIDHGAEIAWFLAPYVNSYKRFVAGTFAPTRLIWSLDNRTAGFRVVGEGGRGVRAECRIGGADLTPHLAYAALIAAGMSGVARGLDLGAPYDGDAYADEAAPEIPTTLRAAAEAMDRSAMLRAAFGDAVIDHYVRCAAWEQAEADRTVTDWDLARGFERA